MIDIGQNIKGELARQERSIYWLAGKLGMTRSTFYRMLEKSTIDTGLLQRISTILGRDFFKELSEQLPKH